MSRILDASCGFLFCTQEKVPAAPAGGGYACGAQKILLSLMQGLAHA